MSNGESESHILTSTWNIKYIKLLKLELNTNFKQLLYDKRIRFLLGTFKSNIGGDIFRIFVSFWFGALSVPSGNPSCTTSLQFLNHNRSWQAPASRSIYKKFDQRRQNNLFPFFNCSPSHNTCYWPQHRMPHLNWKVHPKKKWSQCFKILIITMCNCAKLRRRNVTEPTGDLRTQFFYRVKIGIALIKECRVDLVAKGCPVLARTSHNTWDVNHLSPF